ncbi:MAG: hypothetical protein AABW90_02870 [Nanoarchaeota archaeon]
MKRLCFYLSALFFIGLFLVIISAHHIDVAGNVVSDVPKGVSEIPGGKISGSLGEINPNTGLPVKFSEFKEKADEFRYREQNQSYLKKEWTKILAGNKFFGPFLFYTDKFFSIFNPLWKAVFKIDFSWSWAFFLSFLFWIVLIIMIYYPLQGVLQNNFIGFLISIIVASLIGIAGVISKVVVFLTAVITNIFILIIIILLLALLFVLYIIIMKKSIKQSEEIELETAKEKIKALGKVSGKGLEEMSK